MRSLHFGQKSISFSIFLHAHLFKTRATHTGFKLITDYGASHTQTEHDGAARGRCDGFFKLVRTNYKGPLAAKAQQR